jgi:hypothetical protein
MLTHSSQPAAVARGDAKVGDTSNPELIVYCVYRRGGVGRFVEIEDVYEEAFEIAPSRFGWRTKHLPSDKAATKAMQDASRGRRLPTGLLLFSPNSYGVQLTAEGVAWVRERLEAFEALVDAKAPAGYERASQRHLVALERSEVARRYAAGEDVTATRARFADLLRLTPDADGRAWRERLETYRSAATHAGRAVPLAFLARLEAEHPDWFEVTR